MSTPPPVLTPNIPGNFDLPVDTKEWREIIIKRELTTKTTVNAKTYGGYAVKEQGTSNTFLGSQTYRIVVSFGALPNAMLKSVVHGINTSYPGFKVVALYGTGNDITGSLYISIPNENILLTMDATKINITTSTDLSNYTISYVVVEYIKN